MAKTVEQILRDYLGDQVLTLARLTAEVEALREQVAALELHRSAMALHHAATTATPNGQDHAAPNAPPRS